MRWVTSKCGRKCVQMLVTEHATCILFHSCTTSESCAGNILMSKMHCAINERRRLHTTLPFCIGASDHWCLSGGGTWQANAKEDGAGSI